MLAKAPTPRYLEEGFALPYSANVGGFRFYAMAAAALLFLALYLIRGGGLILAAGIVAASIAYYFFPLVERRPRIGANQYGIFIDGFGVIAWRAVGDIVLRTYAVRSIENRELHIRLSRELDQALIVDWRRLPIYRLLMKLPWRMTHDNVIRIKLEPFSAQPADIHRTLRRMWTFYR